MRKTPLAGEFVRALAPVLRQAASVARALEGRVSNRPKAGEASAVKAALTVADTAAQEALLVPLLEHFPGVRLEAEEDTPSVSRFPEAGEAVVVIDPIDGTLRFYLEGLGPYAVTLGLAVEGIYRAALVALPREGLFFDGERGAGARISRADGAPGSARAEASGPRVFISHDLPEPARERLRAHGLEPVPASGGAISVAPLVPGVCAGLRFVRSGSTGVSIRGRIGALISAEAGALVRGEDGGAFPDEIRAPARTLLVAADETTLAALRDAVAAAAAATSAGSPGPPHPPAGSR
jgi:fructose-1,6-bisphosphatase/inositol monophosphatase family enzyme